MKKYELSALRRVFTIIYVKQTMVFFFWEYSVVDIPCLQFMLHVMLLRMLQVLYFSISTTRSMCAVPSMALFAVP